MLITLGQEKLFCLQYSFLEKILLKRVSLSSAWLFYSKKGERMLEYFSGRFPSCHTKQPDLRDYAEPLKVQSFFYAIQEVLA